jgi:GNAT superfamily N-acetyltransferase
VPPFIRPPRRNELDALREIERAAGKLFIGVGLPEIAAHEPMPVEEMGAYLAGGRAWVAVETNVPVGYALVDLVDGAAHLEQLSVHPDHGRRGVGGALIDHVCTWARQRRLAAVTLTTFTDVPWNAPYYARHGFRVLDEGDLGPGLVERRAEEAGYGLDPALRVCMRRDVG